MPAHGLGGLRILDPHPGGNPIIPPIGVEGAETDLETLAAGVTLTTIKAKPAPGILLSAPEEFKETGAGRR